MWNNWNLKLLQKCKIVQLLWTILANLTECIKVNLIKRPIGYFCVVLATFL